MLKSRSIRTLTSPHAAETSSPWRSRRNHFHHKSKVPPGANRSGAAFFCSFAALKRLPLFWGTGNRSKGTEHAAIAGIWPEHRAALFAVIEKLAGVRRHSLHLSMTALRTSDCGLKFHLGSLHQCRRLSTCHIRWITGVRCGCDEPWDIGCAVVERHFRRHIGHVVWLRHRN